MNEELKKKLYERNNKIIEIVLNEINEKCLDSVDLIGVYGSFCNGDIYEKSDLDLVIIINNKKARILNKCFILEDVGFDIYTQEWDSFIEMAEYKDPFVTKLLDLNIIYKRNDEVLKKYLNLRNKVKTNMQNISSIYEKVGSIFSNILMENEVLKKEESIANGYRILAKIISKTEWILYMVNQSYVKMSVKRIPNEISNLKMLPNNFLDLYLNIVNSKDLSEINNNCEKLISLLKEFLNKFGIKYELENNQLDNNNALKQVITSNNLTGTYEEIYSNWKNKMYHAININSSYLSFVTMASCQEFYDEMAAIFNIQEIDLISFYNPRDLESNAKMFDMALNEWKKLYDLFDKEIVQYNSILELEKLYKK